jgi:hypothetical protein
MAGSRSNTGSLRAKDAFPWKIRDWGNQGPFARGGVVSDNESTSGFQSTVAAISDHGFKGESTIFARFHGLIERTPALSEPDKAVPVSNDELTQKSRYALEEGKTYQLDVTIYSKTFLSIPTFVDAALELHFDSSLFVPLDRDTIPVSGRVDMPSFVIRTKKNAEAQLTFLQISSNPGITRKEASDPGSVALLGDFRGCDWTIPVKVQPNQKARRGRLIQRIAAETLVSMFTLVTASIFARYITGDPTKPIPAWVIPTIICSLILIIVGIWMRIYLDETK